MHGGTDYTPYEGIEGEGLAGLDHGARQRSWCATAR
jgi:hypothetical protein